jgi:hypothetical protein
MLTWALESSSLGELQYYVLFILTEKIINIVIMQIIA